MKTDLSQKLFARAQQLFPGGVNSPVRAFRGVGGTPRFISRGRGSHMWDVDGNDLVDYVGSWGPLILGHCHLPALRTYPVGDSQRHFVLLGDWLNHRSYLVMDSGGFDMGRYDGKCL